jgi:hypothetical protein
MLTATDAVKDRLASYYHWGGGTGKALCKQSTFARRSPGVDLLEAKRWANK